MARPRFCEVCKTKLVGKQLRFCSDAHRSIWWNELRARAVDKPKVSDVPEYQELYEKFLEMILNNRDLIRKILE